MNLLTTLKEYRSHTKARYLIYPAILLLAYITHGIYVWTNTQSTDNAYLEANISNVSSEIEGVVDKVLIMDNIRVNAGDLVAELNDQDYRANLAKAAASVAGSIQNIKIIEQKIQIEQTNLEINEQSLDFAKANLELSSADFDRAKSLKHDNFASQKFLDTSRVAFEKAKSEYNQAKLNVKINQQNLQLENMQIMAEEANLESQIQAKNLAERRLANTKVKAPVSGIIANNSLKVGNYVRPGVVLFSIVPTDKLYVKANFKETQVQKLKAGMVAMLKFDSIPGKKFRSTIRNISPATGSKFSLLPPDNATGNFTKIIQRVPVLIDFEAPEGKDVSLVPGMSVGVSIRTDQ